MFLQRFCTLINTAVKHDKQPACVADVGREGVWMENMAETSNSYL